MGVPTPEAVGPAASLAYWLVVGAAVGLAGAVAMDAPMYRQPDGWTPAFVAAAVLRRVRPDRASFRDALVVHHLAGVLAGVLYGLCGWSVVLLVGPTNGVVAAAVAHVLGVVFVVAFVYVLFAHLVLPRAGAGVYEERATAVRGQWLRSSLVFGAVLFVVGGVAVLA